MTSNRTEKGMGSAKPLHCWSQKSRPVCHWRGLVNAYCRRPVHARREEFQRAEKRKKKTSDISCLVLEHEFYFTTVNTLLVSFSFTGLESSAILLSAPSASYASPANTRYHPRSWTIPGNFSTPVLLRQCFHLQTGSHLIWLAETSLTALCLS